VSRLAAWLEQPQRSRILAIALLLALAAQLLGGLRAFSAEMVHLAVASRVSAWESAQTLPSPAEFDATWSELEGALQLTPRWGELYEMRARLTMQTLNEPDLPVETLDAVVDSARADLDAAAATRPTLPRVPLLQLGLDSLMYLAGTEPYLQHAVDVLRLGPSSRIYLEPTLTVLINDWPALDPASRELTLAGLTDLASVDPSRVRLLLRDAPAREAICAQGEALCGS
jgi:hypothetical protein